MLRFNHSVVAVVAGHVSIVHLTPDLPANEIVANHKRPSLRPPFGDCRDYGTNPRFAQFFGLSLSRRWPLQSLEGPAALSLHLPIVPPSPDEAAASPVGGNVGIAVEQLNGRF